MVYGLRFFNPSIVIKHDEFIKFYVKRSLKKSVLESDRLEVTPAKLILLSQPSSPLVIKSHCLATALPYTTLRD